MKLNIKYIYILGKKINLIYLCEGYYRQIEIWLFDKSNKYVIINNNFKIAIPTIIFDY